MLWIGFLCLEFLLSLKVLHMFQQNRYDYHRFLNWIKANTTISKLFILNGLILVTAYFFSINQGNVTLFLIIINILYIGFQLSQQKSIKPLVYTARIKRLIFTMLCVNGLFNLGMLNILFGILLVFVINYLTVFIADILLKPVEKMIQLYYLKDAQKILNEHKRLLKIGVTGSYGKTSTKVIINDILKRRYRTYMTPASFNTPMGITKCVRSDLKAIHQVFVCEMGADHVGDIVELSDFVQPHIGVVTSIGPQHLETFKNIENIIIEKMQLIEKLPSDGLGVLNMDNDYIRDYQVKNKCRLMTVGTCDANVDVYASDIAYTHKGSTFNVTYQGETFKFETKLLGKHNIVNILIGIAIALNQKIEMSAIIDSVAAIEQVQHRLQLKQINGLQFIDNAFNSNPVGAKESLEILSKMPSKRYIITPGFIDFGQSQALYNYTFGTQMKDKVDVVILVGEKQAQPIYKGLVESGFDLENVIVVATIQEAFAYVYQHASYSDIILLENDLPDAFNR